MFIESVETNKYFEYEKTTKKLSIKLEKYIKLFFHTFFLNSRKHVLLNFNYYLTSCSN